MVDGTLEEESKIKDLLYSYVQKSIKIGNE